MRTILKFDTHYVRHVHIDYYHLEMIIQNIDDLDLGMSDQQLSIRLGLCTPNWQNTPDYNE